MLINLYHYSQFLLQGVKVKKKKWCYEEILILESRMCCMNPFHSAVRTLLL